MQSRVRDAGGAARRGAATIVAAIKRSCGSRDERGKEAIGMRGNIRAALRSAAL